MGYLEGIGHLGRFYVENFGLLMQLPVEIRNPDVLVDKLSTKKDFDVLVDTTIPATYNERIDALKDTMRTASGPERPFRTTMAMVLAVRVACCIVAGVGGGPWAAMGLGLLQFVIAPYSFPISLMLCAALTPPILLCNAITHYSLNTVAGSLLPEAVNGWVTVEITNTFIFLFLLYDQLECFHCLYVTPLGKSRSFTFKETINHVWFGFLNCKTYTVLLLILVWGHRINVLLWALDAYLGLTPRVGRAISQCGAHWAALFYHQHRISHMPKVYEHAHKFHHYLHDTNAFDSHLYGSGMPEEYFCLLVEVVGALALGILPTTLNYNTLVLSASNKIGHTRKNHDMGGANHHADHHTTHTKNYGIYCSAMDQIFGTNYPSNETYQIADYTITYRTPTKTSNATQAVIEFRRTSGATAGSADMQDKFYAVSYWRLCVETFKWYFTEAVPTILGSSKSAKKQ